MDGRSRRAGLGEWSGDLTAVDPRARSRRVLDRAVPRVAAGGAGADGGHHQPPFRTLCREYGGGLYVSEMITTRALVERDPETMRLIEFGRHE